MSQPPDDRHRLPWETDPSEASDEPTVAWTPPSPPGQAPVPGAGPAPGWGTGATPLPATTPAAEPAAAEPSLGAKPAAEPPAAEPPGAQPPATGPLLSSTPSAPIVGWQPPPAAEAAPVEGYVIAGPWARLVGWLLDQVLVAYLPSLLFIFVVDWRTFFDAIVEQSQNPSTAQAFEMPFTTGYGVATVILVGVSYLYFVGFWTGPGRATPGMRLMKMQVTDEHLGATMTVIQATRRWFAMGAWLSLVAFLGAAGSIAGLVQPLLYIALFITVIVNARRQGLHDRAAGSIVIRQRASGDGTVVMGCVVLIGLSILVAIVSLALFSTAVLPDLGPLLDDLVIPT